MVDWAQWARYGLLFDAFSGALFLLLGVGVLLVRPRRQAATLFGLFAVGFGIVLIFANLTREPLALLPGSWAWLYFAGAFLLAPAVVRLAFVFPRRTQPLPKWQLGLCWLGALPFLATAIFLDQTTIAVIGDLGIPFVQEKIILTGWFIAMGSIAFAAMSWAFRLPELSKTMPQNQVRATLLASLSIGLFLAVAQGMQILGAPSWATTIGNPTISWGSGLHGLPFLLVWIIALLRSTAMLAPPISRWTRNAAIAVAATLPVGATIAILTEPKYATDLGFLGLLRTGGFLIFAYMILHKQMLGIDVAFKWTISKGTVAALFLAVFFVVGTVASEWLVDKWGYSVGGVVAGLMLFAINPLQKFGERVANSAMPNVIPISARAESDRLLLFQDMMESAWADGQLSRAESRVLDVARDRLQISLEQARAVEAKFR